MSNVFFAVYWKAMVDGIMSGISTYKANVKFRKECLKYVNVGDPSKFNVNLPKSIATVRAIAKEKYDETVAKELSADVGANGKVSY